MILQGATLDQVQAAAKTVCKAAQVKMKPTVTGAKLTGYIRIAWGAEYRTQNAAGQMHAWQPCTHFYKALMGELANLVGSKYTVKLTLHKHVMSYMQTSTKAGAALYKQGLGCDHAASEGQTLASAPGAQHAPIPALTVPVIKVPAGQPLTFPLIDGAPLEPGQTDKVSDVRAKTRNIHAAIASLYILEECKIGALRVPASISSEIPDHLLMRASHAVQWRNQVLRYAEHYANTLARQMFDYLTMASFGEARYKQGSYYTFDVPGMKESRSHAYQTALRFDPRDLLPKLAHAFNHYSWSAGGYGGKKWGKIATSAALYFKPEFRTCPIAFVDHCFDLAHNGNLAFDKGYILSNPSDKAVYLRILDEKRAGSLLDSKLAHPIFPLVADLLSTGVGLGLVKRPRSSFKIVEDAEVPTLTWGTEHVSMYHGYHGMTTEPETGDDSSDESETPTPSPESEAASEVYPER